MRGYFALERLCLMPLEKGIIVNSGTVCYNSCTKYGFEEVARTYKRFIEI